MSGAASFSARRGAAARGQDTAGRRPPVARASGDTTRMTRYVELSARSAFSFLDGASTPEELVDEAAALELSALALVDRTASTARRAFTRRRRRRVCARWSAPR